MNKRIASAAHALMCALVAAYCAVLAALTWGKTVSALLLCALAAVLFAVLMLASRRASRWGIDCPAQSDPFPMRTFLLAAGMCLLVMLVYLAAYFPGGFSADTLTQWKQLKARSFDDWHPALHTLFLWALTRIADHPAVCTLAQMLCYATAVGYAAAALRRWRLPKPLCFLTAAYLSFSPAIGNVMTFIWKDCAFAISALFLAVFLLETHLSRGAWLKKPVHFAMLAAALCMTSILRHNGPAMTLAAGVWLLVSFPRLWKRLLCALLCAVSLFALIRGPVYDRAHVSSRTNGLGEIYGVPMVVLSHVYAQTPESLSEGASAYMAGFGTSETFKSYDVPGDWNATKWYVNAPDLSAYSLKDVCRFALEAAKAEPQLALDALCGLFDMPLLPFTNAYWRLSPYVTDAASYLGIDQSGVSLAARVLGFICRLSAKPAFAWLFWAPGFPLLLVMLACTLLAKRRPLSALLLPAMLIAYHLATALVLSSPTDFRFFLSTPMLAPTCLAGLVLRPRAAGGSRA